MKCRSCGSDRILQVDAKCSDLCFEMYKGGEHSGYPSTQIGGGDNVTLSICLQCGLEQSQQYPTSDPEWFAPEEEPPAEPKKVKCCSRCGYGYQGSMGNPCVCPQGPTG